jgi:hypothetical protein
METLKIGQKVKLHERALIWHSKLTPSNKGYSQATINWRNNLLQRKNEIAIVRGVYTKSVDIEYPDGHYTMLDKDYVKAVETTDNK